MAKSRPAVQVGPEPTFGAKSATSETLSTRQYARIVHAWVESAGLDSSAYGTHSMRRTKAAQIYKKTGKRA